MPEDAMPRHPGPDRPITVPASRWVGQMSVTLRRALFGVGPVATARALTRRLLRQDPPNVLQGAGMPSSPHPYDAQHGIETAGFRSWRDLQSGKPNDPYISGYLGIAPSMARQVIGLVQDPSHYAFVDLGCGKGRALAVASELPFRRIIGVEIAVELAGVAARNAAALHARYPGRTAIEVLHADAAATTVPPGPLVLFLYQPFEKPVMRAVLDGLTASLLASPRPAVLIYVHPALSRLVDQLPLLERVREGPLLASLEDMPFGYGGGDPADHFVMWRTRAPQPEIRPFG